MQLIDLTHLIIENMPVYPGTSGPRFITTGSLSESGYEERLITMQSHTGTHVDSPAHMVKNGATLDKLELDRFMGKTLLIDCSGIAQIGQKHLSSYGDLIAECEFVILNTGWSRYWGREQYFKDFPVLTPEAGQWIGRLNLKGIGVDTVSVDTVDSKTFLVHKTLLQRNMVILENLTNLDQIKQDIFTLCFFPLKIYNADGSPVRAVALIDSH